MWAFFKSLSNLEVIQAKKLQIIFEIHEINNKIKVYLKSHKDTSYKDKITIIALSKIWDSIIMAWGAL
jgi:hypothetical protein